MQATKNKRTGRFQLAFKDSNGQRQQYTGIAYFPKELKKSDADKRALAIYLKHEKDLKKTANTKLGVCVERMLDHLEATGVKDVKKIRCHAKRALEYNDDNDIEDVVKVAAALRIDMLKKKKADGTKYKGSYIKKLLNTYIRTANLAFQEWDILDAPLALKIKTVKASKPRDRYLSREESLKLLKNCEEDFFHVVSFFILTGIRCKEFSRLGAGDIDDNGVLIIDGKTEFMRSMQLSEAAIIHADHIDFPCDFSYGQLSKRLRDVSKKAGIPDIRLHDLRHTFATWLLQSGDATLYEIQRLLGHGTITQTERYAHLAPSALAHITTNLKI